LCPLLRRLILNSGRREVRRRVSLGDWSEDSTGTITINFDWTVFFTRYLFSFSIL
jgi:hypothetical protein